MVKKRTILQKLKIGSLLVKSVGETQIITMWKFQLIKSRYWKSKMVLKWDKFWWTTEELDVNKV